MFRLPGAKTAGRRGPPGCLNVSVCAELVAHIEIQVNLGIGVAGVFGIGDNESRTVGAIVIFGVDGDSQFAPDSIDQNIVIDHAALVQTEIEQLAIVEALQHVASIDAQPEFVVQLHFEDLGVNDHLLCQLFLHAGQHLRDGRQSCGAGAYV